MFFITLVGRYIYKLCLGFYFYFLRQKEFVLHFLVTELRVIFSCFILNFSGENKIILVFVLHWKMAI